MYSGTEEAVLAAMDRAEECLVLIHSAMHEVGVDNIDTRTVDKIVEEYRCGKSDFERRQDATRYLLV